MNDLDIIEQLSIYSEEPLMQLDTYGWGETGYVLDSENRVKSLTLRGLKIESVPQEIGALTAMEKLHLDKGGLKNILGVENLENLQELILADNLITDITPISKLHQLKRLDIDSNPVRDILPLGKLPVLIELSIRGTEIDAEKLPDFFPLLEILSLGPKQIKNTSFLARLEHLTMLMLDGFDKPEEASWLEELFTNINKLKLKTLDFWDFKGLQVKDIPSFPNLEHLLFYDCGIKNIETLSEYKKLMSVDLYENKVIDASPLNKLSQLTEINLASNPITDLEPLLSFGYTFIWDIESPFRSANEGEIVITNCNELTNPPVEIAMQGHEAIMEYFHQRQKTGTELLLEAKLILLGDARSGKTSLANRLLGKELPTQADRTEGVDIIIGEYDFPTESGATFRLNIWDFAGQDKYKTLHQLFYTESSLYVMVADSGNAATDFDDWLQSAELFGEGSPLIIVLNEFKTGIGSGSFDSVHWKKQFPDLLKEVFITNLLTQENFVFVESHVRLLAERLPHTKYPFPSNWAAIRRELHRRREEQYISFKEYLKICRNNQLSERDSALVLSSVLHKIGDCLHYQKSELLRQYVILKNEWATDAVYKILDDPTVAEEKCGFFDLGDVQRVWSSEVYQDMRPQLLELMQQFKLAYQLPGREEYVTPPLLPQGRPAHFEWSDQPSLQLYVTYEFLPKALLTQFIVSRHKDIAEQRTLVWRQGVILEWEGEALAEVTKTKLRGLDAISIKTQGVNRKGMMTVVLKTLRGLHAEYSGIKYKEEVPCQCRGCQAADNRQFYFDFAHLKRRLEKGRFEVECNESFELVNVLELLENTVLLEYTKKGVVPDLKRKIDRIDIPPKRRLRLFLACSNELKEEREQIEIMISRKNRSWRERNFEVELLIWENGKYVGHSFRSQNNYNLEVVECTLFTLLFYSKVGKFSFEEFEKAKACFDSEGLPRILIFQKDINLPKGMNRADADSRFDFVDMLRSREHFPETYQNTDELLRILTDKVDSLLDDEKFIGRLPIV